MAARFLAGEPEKQQAVAADIVSFGDLIQQIPLGQRWLNLELSIAPYQLALQVRTREAFPQQWGTIQNNPLLSLWVIANAETLIWQEFSQ